MSVVFARCVRAELERRGVDGSGAFARAGITQERLREPQARLSFEETIELCNAAAELCPEPALGLLIGGAVPLHMLQWVGHLLLSQTSLREAVESLQRVSSLLADGLQWRVDLESSTALVSVTLPEPLGAAAPCIADFTLALMARVWRRFLPATASLSFVSLRRSAPSYASHYAEAFACPVHFAQPRDGIAVSRALFERTQVHADPVSRRVLEAAALDLLYRQQHGVALTQRVRMVLRSESNLAHHDPTRIARQLGLGLRTLRRRLADEGTNFRKLLDEARSWHACQSLRREGANIKEVAAELGFSDPTSFHRAFRRWTGMTPAAYAKQSEASVVPPL